MEGAAAQQWVARCGSSASAMAMRTGQGLCHLSPCRLDSASLPQTMYPCPAPEWEPLGLMPVIACSLDRPAMVPYSQMEDITGWWKHCQGCHRITALPPMLLFKPAAKEPRPQRKHSQPAHAYPAAGAGAVAHAIQRTAGGACRQRQRTTRSDSTPSEFPSTRGGDIGSLDLQLISRAPVARLLACGEPPPEPVLLLQPLHLLLIVLIILI